MSSSSQVVVVVLRCAHSVFGASIAHVREIVMVPEIMPVPESSAHLCGIIKLRDRVMPVLDLGLLLGLGPGPRDRQGRIVVVEPRRGVEVGLLVNEASEVLRLSEEQISTPPELVAGALHGCVRQVACVAERMLLLLDLPSLLEAANTEAFQATAAENAPRATEASAGNGA